MEERKITQEGTHTHDLENSLLCSIQLSYQSHPTA